MFNIRDSSNKQATMHAIYFIFVKYENSRGEHSGTGHWGKTGR